MRKKNIKKKIFLDNKIKEKYASLSEYADANRVELNGVVIVHLNKIPELVVSWVPCDEVMKWYT